MIKRICFTFCVSLGGLLSGCSTLLNTFIPDQPFENPFRLNDRSVTLTMELPADPFAPLTAALYSGGLMNSSINLNPSVLGPTRPTGIEEKLTFVPTINISSGFANNAPDPQAVFPEMLIVTTMQLTFTAVDGPSGPRFEKNVESVYEPDLVLTKQQCVTNPVNTTCTYTTDTEATLFQLQFLGEDFNTLFDFLTAGGEPNTISGRLGLEFIGEVFPPVDSKMTIILKTSEGMLKF
jgi:hypothetical protein